MSLTVMARIFFLMLGALAFGNRISAQEQGGRALRISYLTDQFYVYTTYNMYENNRIPAHGLYHVTDSGVVLLDTPWDTTQFQPLLDSIYVRHRKKVVVCIATHWHSDRTEGLEYYAQRGIRTYTTVMTDGLCRKNGKKRAEFLMRQDTLFTLGRTTFEVYYPGGGHTEDNIVVWFGKERILYGGCLIKGAEADNLGYLGDADIAAYETTLRKVQRRYPDPKYILVSHHDWNNVNALKKSIELAAKLQVKK